MVKTVTLGTETAPKAQTTTQTTQSPLPAAGTLTCTNNAAAAFVIAMFELTHNKPDEPLCKALTDHVTLATYHGETNNKGACEDMNYLGQTFGRFYIEALQKTVKKHPEHLAQATILTSEAGLSPAILNPETTVTFTRTPLLEKLAIFLDYNFHFLDQQEGLEQINDYFEKATETLPPEKREKGTHAYYSRKSSQKPIIYS